MNSRLPLRTINSTNLNPAPTNLALIRIHFIQRNVAKKYLNNNKKVQHLRNDHLDSLIVIKRPSRGRTTGGRRKN